VLSREKPGVIIIGSLLRHWGGLAEIFILNPHSHHQFTRFNSDIHINSEPRKGLSRSKCNADLLTNRVRCIEWTHTHTHTRCCVLALLSFRVDVILHSPFPIDCTLDASLTSSATGQKSRSYSNTNKHQQHGSSRHRYTAPQLKFTNSLRAVGVTLG